MKKLFLILCLLSMTAHAEKISLYCSNPNNNSFFLEFAFDEEKQLVWIDGTEPVMATISPYGIGFYSKDFFYNLNRLNGLMEIRRLSNYAIMSSFNCDTTPRVRKF